MKFKVFKIAKAIESAVIFLACGVIIALCLIEFGFNSETWGFEGIFIVIVLLLAIVACVPVAILSLISLIYILTHKSNGTRYAGYVIGVIAKFMTLWWGLVFVITGLKEANLSLTVISFVLEAIIITSIITDFVLISAKRRAKKPEVVELYSGERGEF